MRPLLTAAALLGGLVIGIPIAPSVLLALALGTAGLCWWLDALSESWRQTDPGASRTPAFLGYAVPSACLVGGWLFAVLWTWSAGLRDSYLGYPAEKVAADFGFTFWSVLTVLVVAATLAVPHYLRTRSLRPVAMASGAVLVVLETGPPKPGDCAQPLDNNVKCTSDKSEKLTLGPAGLSTVDIADAEAEQTTTGYAVRLEFTAKGQRRWADLTRANVGKRLAFLMNDELLSAPEIVEPLTGDSVQLPGPFTTLDQARKVSDAIRGN